MKKITIFIILFQIILEFIEASAQEKKYIRKGNKYYNNKEYQKAEIMYQKALEKNFSSKEANFNLGNTFYRQEKYDAAIEKFENVAISSKGDDKEKSFQFYNLGNAYFKNQKLKESVEAYKKSLKYDPNNYDARHNLQLAIFMLKNQNSQQNQNEKNKEDKNNNKDEQKKQEQKQNQQQQNQNVNKEENINQEKSQISKEDAERLLNELNRREKEVLQKVELQKRSIQKMPVDKNW